MGVLRHGRRHVGVMMLDVADRTAGCVGGGPPAGLVAGVAVGGEELGADAGQRLEVRRGGFEGLLSAEVVHVADVLGQPGPAGARDAQGVLQVAADREHGRHAERQVDRQRRVTARPADRKLRLVHDPHDGVVAATWMGRSWVSQASARPARPFPGLVVVGDQRLAGRLPLVMTSAAGPGGSPGKPSSRWCSGV